MVRLFLRASLAGPLGLLLLSTAVSVSAQYGGRSGGRVTEGPRVDVAGTIEGLVQGGGIVVMGTNRLVWRLQITPETNVRVNGKAARAFLRAGQLVSFRATVDRRRGTVEEKVARMTIFTPTQQTELGLALDPAEEAVGPEAGAQPLVGLMIRGRVTGIKDGGLVVNVPNRFFKPVMEVPVAEDLDLSIDLVGANFVSLASQGDGIQASGQLIGPQAMRVQNATVTLTKVLGTATEAAEKIRPNRQKKPPRRTTKDAAENQDMEASDAAADAPDDAKPAGKGESTKHPAGGAEAP